MEQKLVAEEEGEVAQHKRERWISQEGGLAAARPRGAAHRQARIERARKLMAEARPPQGRGAADGVRPRLGRTIAEAKQVHKRFGDREVLRGVDFLLQRGERVGIVGPNGVEDHLPAHAAR